MTTTTDNIRSNESIAQTCLRRCQLLLNNINQHKRSPYKPEDLKKYCKIKTNIKQESIYLHEVNSIKLIRLRSFSHWPHSLPNGQLMSSNGWFSCNVSDRVICIYCNTICHSWKKDDDPFQIHFQLAPKCPFIISKLLTKTIVPIVNDTFEVCNSPSHPSMSEFPRRSSSFNQNWTQTTPTIDEFARAGFFYSGTNSTVTCFFCGGSLQNWGLNDNPTVEHARWFPHCQYVKDLCGQKFFNQIQISKTENKSKIKFDETNVSRLVAARLDLPVVIRFLSFYNLSIIKRCIEDQLKMKQNDFSSDGDLFIACLILQKQIQIIQGNKEKLIIPSSVGKITIEKPLKSVSSSSDKKINYCLICLTDEKELACIPCGHLCACVPCAHSLRSCPICRQQIKSFIRIYS